MELSRRRFLQMSSATIAGAPFLARAHNTIEVYIARNPEEPVYQDKAFDLAERYLQEEVGLNIQFLETTAAQLWEKKFDHKTTFGIVEVSPEEAAERLSYGQPLRERQERPITDFPAFFNEVSNTYKLEHIAAPELDLATYEGLTLEQSVERFSEFMDGIILSKYKTERHGEAYPEAGFTTIIGSPENPSHGNANGVTEQTIRTQAKTILHELLHLVGLWHEGDFNNDDVTMFVPDGNANVINIMRYTNPNSHGPYGFGLSPSQKQWVREYFAGGKPFELCKKHEWDIRRAYLKDIAREYGYTFHNETDMSSPDQGIKF